MVDTIKINQLADFIEQLPPERFDVRYWFSNTNSNIDLFISEPESTHQALRARVRHDCGTTACIGGWAEVLFVPPEDRESWASNEVGDLLGLTPEQSDVLFFSITAYNPSKERVVEVLRHLAETDVVDWEHGLPYQRWTFTMYDYDDRTAAHLVSGVDARSEPEAENLANELAQKTFGSCGCIYNLEGPADA